MHELTRHTTRHDNNNNNNNPETHRHPTLFIIVQDEFVHLELGRQVVGAALLAAVRAVIVFVVAIAGTSGIVVGLIVQFLVETAASQAQSTQAERFMSWCENALAAAAAVCGRTYICLQNARGAHCEDVRWPTGEDTEAFQLSRQSLMRVKLCLHLGEGDAASFNRGVVVGVD